MLQNVRSLRNKLSTMRTNSVELGQNDVIAITESWLSQDVTDSELQAGLSDHTWFRRDRPTHGGGVACAVRSSMSPVRRCDLEPADAELMVVELGTTPRVLLSISYCPPADGQSLGQTMTALRSVVGRYPDRCCSSLATLTSPMSNGPRPLQCGPGQPPCECRVAHSVSSTAVI